MSESTREPSDAAALAAALRNIRTRSYSGGQVHIASDYFDDLLEAATRLAATPLDVERLVTAAEAILGTGEVSTRDGAEGTDVAARMIAAEYDRVSRGAADAMNERLG